jgi:tRNA pseudouridine55 synthase
MNLDGFINLNKPSGPTSMEMVRMVKRVTGEKKVGHGGTLDPFANGVLPICFGRATRFMQYLIDGKKLYRAKIHLGIVTDSFDLLGKVIREENPSMITKENLLDILGQFVGTIDQIPPMFSALKINGQRLYKLARLGQEVERSPRKVTVYRIELIDWDPPEISLEIECGRGVYIRSLAYDLGEALGCGAFLKELTRLRTGPFSIENSTTSEEFETLGFHGEWKQRLCPADVILYDVKKATISSEMESFLRNGRKLSLRDPSVFGAVHGEMCRVYNAEGEFLGVVNFDSSDQLWQPKLVLG